MRLTKSTIQWCLRIIVAAALLYLLFRFIPISEVMKVMVLADGWWVAAAFVILIFERLTAAWRMKLLTDQLAMPLSVFKLWEISTVSVFYTTFLPGDIAGGAIRWYRMSKPLGQRAQAFAALAFERLIDTIILILFGLVFWIWDDPPFGTWLLYFVLITFLVALVLVMAVSLSPRTSRVFETIIGLIPWKGFRQFTSEKIEKVLVSVRTFRQLSFTKITALVMLSALRHLLSILIIICFAQALAMSIGFPTIGWIRSLMNIITMLPIAFAGLGVREASFTILMEPYGIPGSQAVALGLFMFIVHIVLAIIGGLLELRGMFMPQQQQDMESVPPATDDSSTTQ